LIRSRIGDACDSGVTNLYNHNAETARVVHAAHLEYSFSQLPQSETCQKSRNENGSGDAIGKHNTL
jgi:hypothetical protein